MVMITNGDEQKRNVWALEDIFVAYHMAVRKPRP